VFLIQPDRVETALKAQDLHQFRITELTEAEDANELILRQQFLQTSAHDESSKRRDGGIIADNRRGTRKNYFPVGENS